MDSLTESEMGQIARQQREAGVPRLSRHFSWPEFCDERRCFHQEFVYDAAMFAAARGFPWPAVIQVAAVAKGIFPRLDGPDIPGLSSLLRDALSECLLNLTPVHRHEFTRFLVGTCVARRRLFQAAVGGGAAADTSVAQLHLEVQLPPTPCPLAQGTDLHEREHQEALTSMLRQKEVVPEGEQPGKRAGTTGHRKAPQPRSFKHRSSQRRRTS